MVTADKPPYRVPLMDEVRAIPLNGLRVASTFAGGGGSSLGYRMAGFKVVWANEFVERARETYLANFPDTHVDGRSIRDVKPEDVLAAAGLREGELDLFDGSPPCTAFSTAGKREKLWGTQKKTGEHKQRDDDLFFEYVRMLRGLRPRVFVAENVSGLARGKAVGMFLEVKKALEACGYRVEARLLDAQWLGVPQRRQRIIFVGVRDDLDAAPCFPTPLPYRYSIRDACPWVIDAEARNFEWTSPGDGPMFTITTGPDSFRVTKEVAGAVVLDEPAPCLMAHGVDGAAPHQVLIDAPPPPTAEMLRGRNLEEWQALEQGEAGGFRNLLARTHPDQPAPTITALGGRSGIAAVSHPTEPRKFTIEELKRLSSFPDDYVLRGTFEEQWARCGNCVPPLMMRAVATAIRDGIFAKLDGVRP